MKKEFLSKEKRVHPRISAKIPITYRIFEENLEIKSLLERAEKNKTTHTLDVSLGGLFIFSKEPVTERSLMKLEMSIPDNPSKLRAMAEVVRSNESGTGVRFLAIEEEDVQFLKVYLEKSSFGK